MRKTKLLLKMVLFLAVFGVILVLLMNVLSIKRGDGSLPMHNYYDLPEGTVDVLFLGSSHAGMNISMPRLFHEYGTAGYNCWASTQPIWNTYYYLKECLKSQKPKLIVLDVHGAVFGYEYADYSMRVNNLSGLRFSKNKIDAVFASAPKGERADLILELPTTHQRYTDLTKEDFEYFPWNDHAGLQEYSNEEMDRIYPISIAENDGHREPLCDKEKQYLERIIETCREADIPLELITSPYRVSDVEVGRFNEIAKIAEENGLRFTNFNDLYEEIGIDPETDFLDAGHFNKYGVPKYTKAIYELILADYELPDRRKDPDHLFNQSEQETAKPSYTMANRFEGDGTQALLDTGAKLFDNPYASWTLLTRIRMPEKIVKNEDRVFMGCFDVKEGRSCGLEINVNEEGGLICRFNSLQSAEVLGLSSTVDLAVSKNGQAVSIYVNGEKTSAFELNDPISYDGSLIVGAELDADGVPFRFSRMTVENLEIYDKVLYDSTIAMWNPEALPDPEKVSYSSTLTSSDSILAELTHAYEGDGIENIVDTGVSLYEDPESSWTILAKLDAEIPSGDNVYFADFAEEEGNYRGILVRRPEAGKLNIVYGSGKGMEIEIPKKGIIRLAIRKEKNAYTIFVDDEKVLDSDAAPCSGYSGNLMLGCELDEYGKAFRFSGTRITNFMVVSELLSDEFISAWDPKELAAPEEPSGSAVSYQLEEAFAGDGSKYIDTKMQLYDVPAKNWTLELVTDNLSGESGTLVSCFAEDPSDYRGLLIRMTDDHTFGITVGKNYQEISSDEKVTGLAITKKDADYVIYCNGKKAAEVSGKCASYDGTLLVGAEKSQSGGIFRQSKVFIRTLMLDSSVKTEEEILKDYLAVKDRKVFQK